MWFALACIGGGLASAQPVEEDSVIWQWNERPRTYFVTTDVQLVYPLVLAAENNLEVDVSQVQLDLVTTCRVADSVGKKAWRLRCSHHDLALRAAPVRPGQKRQLFEVLEEVETGMRAAHTEVVLQRDGRVRTVQLQEFPSRNSRERNIAMVVELVLSRSFVGFDLQLPKAGDLVVGKPWRQRSAQAFMMPTSSGAMSTGNISHTAEITDRGMLLETVGDGLISLSETVGVYEATLTGKTLIDASAGQLLERSMFVRGNPSATTSNLLGQRSYVHALQMIALDGTSSAPALGGSGEIQAVPAGPVPQ